MKLTTRIKAAVEAYRGVRLVGGGWTAGASSFVRWLLPGTSVDYAALAGLGYDNSVVLIALNWLWKQVQYARPTVARRVAGKKRRGRPVWEEIDPHPFTEAVKRAVHYGYSSLVFGTLCSLLVRGNAYWLKVRGANTGAVVGFVYLPHHLVEPRSDKGNDDGQRLITYYRYTVPGGGQFADFDVRDVVHFRWGIDPQAMGLGLSPLFAIWRSIVGENRAETLSASLLDNAGMAGFYVSPKESMELPSDPEKLAEFKEKFQRATTRDMAGTPLILDFPADIKELGFSPDKLSLDKTRALNTSRICAAIGIAPMVLGLPDDQQTYSNLEEATESAYEGTVEPLLGIIFEALDAQCFRTDFLAGPDERLKWDVSEVPAKQDDQDKLVARTVAAYKGDLVTKNEGREWLGYDEVEGGDEFFSEAQIARAKEMMPEDGALGKPGKPKKDPTEDDED